MNHDHQDEYMDGVNMTTESTFINSTFINSTFINSTLDRPPEILDTGLEEVAAFFCALAGLVGNSLLIAAFRKHLRTKPFVAFDRLILCIFINGIFSVIIVVMPYAVASISGESSHGLLYHLLYHGNKVVHGLHILFRKILLRGGIRERGLWSGSIL